MNHAAQRRPLMRLLILLIVICLMGGAVFIIGGKLRHGANQEPIEWSQVIDHGSPLDRIANQENSMKVSRLSTPALEGAVKDANVRDLNVYYARREYVGAPPRIPHELESDMHTGDSCNVCHQRGGFVEKFKAYAPVTPHPEYENCLQCHVGQDSEETFLNSHWESVAPPPLHRPMLPGAPPPIPHTLQLRDNCLACHAGPAAPLEIRTTHPERIHCRQCHVPSTPGTIFSRTQGNEELL